MSSQLDEVTEVVRPSNEEQTQRWLREQFERLGADADLALLLVGEGLDYHEVENLTARGCELELALRIAR